MDPNIVDNYLWVLIFVDLNIYGSMDL